MSGKPNPQGLAQLKTACKEVLLFDEFISLNTQTIHKLTIATQERQRERYETVQRILALLDEMGLASSGNTGWEQRIVYALSQLADDGVRETSR